MKKLAYIIVLTGLIGIVSCKDVEDESLSAEVQQCIIDYQDMNHTVNVDYYLGEIAIYDQSTNMTPAERENLSNIIESYGLTVKEVITQYSPVPNEDWIVNVPDNEEYKWACILKLDAGLGPAVDVHWLGSWD